MNLNQLSFYFTFNSADRKHLNALPPLPVRIIARRHRLSIPLATVVCRETGIGGKAVL